MVAVKEEPVLNTGKKKKKECNRRGKREREKELVPLPKLLILVE